MTDNDNETPLADSFKQWLELNPELPAPVEEPRIPAPTESQKEVARFFGFNPDADGFWIVDNDGETRALVNGFRLSLFTDSSGEPVARNRHYNYYSRDVLRAYLVAASEQIERQNKLNAETRAEAERKAARPVALRIECVSGRPDNFENLVLPMLGDYYIQHAFHRPDANDSLLVEVYILELEDRRHHDCNC